MHDKTGPHSRGLLLVQEANESYMVNRQEQPIGEFNLSMSYESY
jgi:hypothetical protein